MKRNQYNSPLVAECNTPTGKTLPMSELGLIPMARPTLAQLFAAAHAPQIAMAALIRLRWIAVVGQVLAVGGAQIFLGIPLPLMPIGIVIGLTALSNVFLVVWVRMGRARGWLVPGVLLLDILLLTALLFFTGGWRNPFSELYLVNLAMAVLVLRPRWAWVFVAIVGGCFGSLFVWHQPLVLPPSLPSWAMEAGQWAGLSLSAVLLAVFVGRVVRELHDREKELADARQRAARNAHLAALTTLAAGAAHELGTPLGTIAVVARELELAAATCSAGQEMVEDARLIREEVERCRGILARMRVDIAEDGDKNQGAVSVAELVGRVAADLEPGRRGRLDVELGGSGEERVGAARAVQQAVAVMVRNAFDACGNEDRVRLTAGCVDGRVRLEISDHGCGMSAEVLRRAGEPFFTTKPPGSGMGLGLFLVRLVAERYGGRLAIQSVEGEGTTCVLEMPLV
mgnify:CR=1 FL=1